MTQATKNRWETMKTTETDQVEQVLREARFEQADAYRYNSASIRVRVIDPSFEGMSNENRDAMVEPILESLDERTQGDILSLLTFAPAEVASPEASFKSWLLNLEFEDPTPSIL